VTVVTDFLTTSVYQAGFSVLILCVLLVVGVYMVSIFRDYAAEDREDPHKGIANLEEMHAKGDISDEEFRTIQSRSHQLSAETSSTEGFPTGDRSTTT
jgi:uncharacterized membrane protein